MVWSLSPATPAALALVGVVELVAGLIDIVAPKRIVSGLSPAEAAVLPLIGPRAPLCQGKGFGVGSQEICGQIQVFSAGRGIARQSFGGGDEPSHEALLLPAAQQLLQGFSDQFRARFAAVTGLLAQSAA